MDNNEDDRRRSTLRFVSIVLAVGVALGLAMILILLAEYHIGPLR
jgi:ABC-type lipoprotein release transport system permease subunit